ncbi:hypothetical protein CC2G_002243 [Coprinopsis cinerea AmutBmut pab1-1]|nr:hypothetical protein CC2G_002243 [Coprinopsis cinerea AmutBmut pab1-1]
MTKPKSRRVTIEEVDDPDDEVVKKKNKVENKKETTTTAAPTPSGMRPYVQVPNRKPHTLGTFKPKSKQTEATPKAVSTAPEKEDVPIDPLVATHRQGPAFSKKAPVEEHVSVAKIGKELLELEFPISLQKLIISNEAREFLRKMVTKRKVPRHGDDLILERKLLNQFVYNVSDDERRRCKHACLLFKMWDSGELAGRLDLSDYETDEEPSDESKVAEPTSPEVLSQNFISLNDLPTVQYEVAGEDDVDLNQAPSYAWIRSNNTYNLCLKTKNPDP